MIVKKRADVVNRELKRLFPQIHTALNYSTPWELLVAVILSAQCTDKMVNKVTATLFKKYPTIVDCIKADEETFAQDIRSTGFYRSKAHNILKTARMIQEQHSGEVPRTMEELTQLGGVGRKTANIVLSEIYGTHVGVAVDTHVRRLTRLFGLTENDTPEKIEQDLMRVVPREDWRSFSLRLVEYGRQYHPSHKGSSYVSPIVEVLQKETEDV